MDCIKFKSLCQNVINEYKVEGYTVLYWHYDGMSYFIVMFNQNSKKIVHVIINELTNFAVVSENGKIKIEIDNENKMYQY